MATQRKRTTSRKTMAQAGLDPVSAARKRIEVCKRLGMAVDPRDEQIVEEAS